MKKSRRGTVKTKDFDKEKFIAEYRKVVKKSARIDPVSPILIISLINDYLTSKKLKEKVFLKTLIQIFKTVIKKEGKSAECLYVLGYCNFLMGLSNMQKCRYYIRGRFLLNLDWPTKDFKSALIYFRKALKKRKFSIIYAFLAFCNGALRGYSKSLYYFKKLESLSFHKKEESFARHIAEHAFFISHLKSGHFYYRYKKYNQVVKTLEKCSDLKIIYDRKGIGNISLLFYYFLLFVAYRHNRNYERAIANIKKCQEICPRFFILYTISADTYLDLGKYKLASQDFLKSLKVHLQAQDSQPCPPIILKYIKFLFEFSSGVAALKKWYSKGENPERVNKHFSRCCQLIKIISYKDYKYFKLLTYFIEIDEQIRTLSHLCNSKNNPLVELKITVYRLFKKINRILLKYGYFKGQPIVANVEILRTLVVEYIFHIKLFYLSYLYRSLKKNGFKYVRGLGSDSDGDYSATLKKFNVLIEVYKMSLKNIGFDNVVYAFDYLKTFQKRINNRNIRKITKREGKDLVRSLNQYLGDIGDDLSFNGIALMQHSRRNIIRIDKRTDNINKKVYLLDKKFGVLVSDVADMKEMTKKLKEFIKKTEVSEPPEEKKIKISQIGKEKRKEYYPNEKDLVDVQKNLKNDKNYKIGINEINNEVKIGKDFYSFAASSNYAVMLVELILNRHKPILDDELFRKFSKYRKDHGKVQIMLESGEYKGRVHSWFSKIHNITQGKLKHYIQNIERYNLSWYKFDESVTFYVIYFTNLHKQTYQSGADFSSDI